MDRIKQSARDYTEAEKFFKSEIYRRYWKELDDRMKTFRDRCKLDSDSTLHRNQGKWAVLEEIKPLFEKILGDLKKEAKKE